MISDRQYTSIRAPLSETMGSALTPASSSRLRASVSFVVGLIVCTLLILCILSPFLSLETWKVPMGRLSRGLARRGKATMDDLKCRDRKDRIPEREIRWSNLMSLLSSLFSLPPIAMMGIREQLLSRQMSAAFFRFSSGESHTSFFSGAWVAFRALQVAIVCASSSSKIWDLALLTRILLMASIKSLALIIPQICLLTESHRGAAGIPCS
mmetsp:Transcript_5225/g.18317  ORF Transcript_5225/g.18317 Transcript_5225/m.18317 type:complete len:210 (-) Transcript_5225:381-1010(-)